MKFISVSLMAGSVFLAGCSTMHPLEAESCPPQPTAFVINAAFDDVWNTLIERGVERSWSFKLVDKASGLISTDFINIGNGLDGYNNAKLVACDPGGALSVWSSARQSTSILVSKIAQDRTRLKISLHTEVFESNVSHEWYVWHSRGMNERLVADSIAKKLGVSMTPTEVEKPQQEEVLQQPKSSTGGCPPDQEKRFGQCYPKKTIIGGSR